MLASLLSLVQAETRANVPNFFLPIVLILLVLGVLAWLIAAVLGFARARAFGASTRWFALASVCLILYHIQWLMFALAIINVPDTALSVGVFFNLFVVAGGLCAIIGFVRLTNPQ